VLGAAPYRGAEPARVCWASPAELLGGQRGIATTVAAPVARAGVGPAPGKAAVTAVAVALTGAGTAGLAIGLRGAEQVGDLVLTTDPAGAGVAIAAVRAEPGVPVRMTVASDLASVRGQLGVLAAAGDSATIEQFGLPAAAVWLAESVAAGLPALAAPPTIAGPGRSAFVWEEPDR
jgi:hypothetical protein